VGFFGIFLFAATVLAALVAGSFLLPGPWVWLIGPPWIAYDTWQAVHHLRRGLRAVGLPARPVACAGSPPLSVLIAAHNEAAGIVPCLTALGLGPEDEAVVIDDGSDDGTPDLVAGAWGLTWGARDAQGVRWATSTAPGVAVRVLSQPRAGKARALNRALAEARNPVIVTIDGDTVLGPGALAALRAAFAGDPGLTAACGILDPCGPGGTAAGWWVWCQRREYARAFLWRAGWAADRMLILVPGAFAAYDTAAVRAVGGFATDSQVEDYELMYRLHRAQPGTRAVVVATAHARTEVPTALGPFLRQRRRWFGGFITVLWQYRAMVGDRRHGALGTWHLRIKTVDTLLPLYGFAAVAVLAVIWVRDGQPGPAVLGLLALKIGVDALIQAIAARAVARWQVLPVPSWLGSMAASVVEQIAFQPLRQLGAALGWVVVAARATGGGRW